MSSGEAKILYFDSIPAVPKKEMILARLGFKNNITLLENDQRAFLEEGITRGLSLCHPKGVFGRFKIVEKVEDRIILDNDLALQSRSLAKLLDRSCEVVLMAATVGKEVVEESLSQVQGGDAALGVIIDSTASQTADAAITWIMECVDKLVRREGKRVTKHRYSPGFGDLSLINQKAIFEMLDLSRLGLGITDKHMLVPEKSVIAIIGIEGCKFDEEGRILQLSDK